MKIEAKDIRIVPIDEIMPNPKNRNKHPESQIEHLMRVIKVSGFRDPLTISNQSGKLVCGHGRLIAAKRLGYIALPVTYQDFESPAIEFAHAQADNALASQAELDLSGINFDLPEFGPELDLDLLGISNFVLDAAEILEPGCDEDEVPEKVEPKTKLGDLYILGEHRLLCGDSTNIQHVEKLMDGQKADITFTSPPYNAERKPMQSDRNRPSHQSKKYLTHNDGMDQSEWADLVSASLACAMTVSSYQIFNVQHLAGNKVAFIEWLHKFKGNLVDTLIWDKEHGPPQMAEKVLNSRFEYIFIFSEEENPSKAIRCATFNRNLDNVYTAPRRTKNEFSGVHAATFPVHLPEFIAEKFSPKSGSIIDLFGGTGTTLIACEKTKRKCFMMELDPHYCDVIVARWEKFTGNKVALVELDQEYAI